MNPLPLWKEKKKKTLNNRKLINKENQIHPKKHFGVFSAIIHVIKSIPLLAINFMRCEKRCKCSLAFFPEVTALHFLFHIWLSHVTVWWWYFLHLTQTESSRDPSGTSFRQIISHMAGYRKHNKMSSYSVSLNFWNIWITHSKYTKQQDRNLL